MFIYKLLKYKNIRYELVENNKYFLLPKIKKCIYYFYIIKIF